MRFWRIFAILQSKIPFYFSILIDTHDFAILSIYGHLRANLALKQPNPSKWAKITKNPILVQNAIFSVLFTSYFGHFHGCGYMVTIFMKSMKSMKMAYFGQIIIEWPKAQSAAILALLHDFKPFTAQIPLNAVFHAF